MYSFSSFCSLRRVWPHRTHTRPAKNCQDCGHNSPWGSLGDLYASRRQCHPLCSLRCSERQWPFSSCCAVLFEYFDWEYSKGLSNAGYSGTIRPKPFAHMYSFYVFISHFGISKNGTFRFNVSCRATGPTFFTAVAGACRAPFWLSCPPATPPESTFSSSYGRSNHVFRNSKTYSNRQIGIQTLVSKRQLNTNRHFVFNLIHQSARLVALASGPTEPFDIRYKTFRSCLQHTLILCTRSSLSRRETASKLTGRKNGHFRLLYSMYLLPKVRRDWQTNMVSSHDSKILFMLTN